MDSAKSEELRNAQVVLDKLIYQSDSGNLPPDRPHAFIYFLTIRNLSDRRFTLLGRKWILTQADGRTEVIEGDKIVGETPTLAPGEEFSYNSYHVAAVNTTARGSFHGVDEFEKPIHVKIPPFEMKIPENPAAD
ncbi:MAG TPA: ApaG domain [Opitutales bacterium]|nr:ApaG domain [Opitutales bacterium]